MSDTDPCMYRGTDVSYAAICRRRAWLSIHEVFITEGSDFVREGRYLSGKTRKSGTAQLQMGRNRMDNIDMSGNELVIHEYKRGRKLLKADEMQLSHYINCLKTRTDRDVKGILHMLSSKNIAEITLTNNRIDELKQIYSSIDMLRESDMPDAVRNEFCFHGCSFRDFCWG